MFTAPGKATPYRVLRQYYNLILVVNEERQGVLKRPFYLFFTDIPYGKLRVEGFLY